MKKAAIALTLFLVCFTGYVQGAYKFKNVALEEISDSLEWAIGDDLYYVLDLQGECASLDAPKSIVNYVSKHLGMAHKYYSKIMDKPVEDRQTQRRFTKAHRYEVAAFFKFASYLYRKCETEFNQPLIRKLYYFTRQAKRSPVSFRRSTGEALFDYWVQHMEGKEIPGQFVAAYNDDDLDGVILVAMFSLKTSWDLNTRIKDKYENWEIRKVGTTEDILRWRY